MIIKVRTVHRRMTSGRKASALRQPASVELFADDRKIHLRVAAQAQIIIPRHKHFCMHRAVDLVASRTPFANGFMLKDKRTALFFVAIKTGFIDPF